MFSLLDRTVRFLTLISLLLGGHAGSALAGDDLESALSAKHKQKNKKVLRFDVAENGARFSFDVEPVDEDGLPAYGGEFITEGYLYPHGFLEGREGVDENGDPTFPKKVVGRWSCRGWHVGEGAKTETGPWVITNQYFDLGENFGAKSLITEGLEVVDQNVPIERAITGGTGRFRNARGASIQRMLGFNPSQGVNLRVELRPRR